MTTELESIKLAVLELSDAKSKLADARLKLIVEVLELTDETLALNNKVLHTRNTATRLDVAIQKLAELNTSLSQEASRYFSTVLYTRSRRLSTRGTT